ncbi:MAG: hypothetical protein O2973_01250 [Gemmatimonadetes bacterium]|nr:hypothetical protein [Gemmatimonadota bacterium]
MNRTFPQKVSLIGAVLFGTAPLGFGLFRAISADGDSRLFWMAVASVVFAAGVMAAAIGRRRSRREVRVQATVIFVVCTLFAAGAGFLLGASAAPGVWAVAVVLGLCVAVASMLVRASRPDVR